MAIRLYSRLDRNWEDKSFESLVFPGGEVHVKLGDSARTGREFLIDLRFEGSDDFLTALVLNDALRRQNQTEKVYLYCPYLPAARQDRGAPLSAKVYADLINGAGFDKVIGADPHSDVMPALLDRFQTIDVLNELGHTVLSQFDQSTTALVIPDQGASKRVETVAERFGFQTIQGFKHRDFATGQLSGFLIGPVVGWVQDLVIVDDICDGGGTFIGLADVIDPSFNLHLVVTHGIFSKGVDELFKRFKSIHTTDSLPSASQPGVQVIPTLHLAHRLMAN